MHWIYFSPHFDDVVLSCGGLIRQQTQRGDRVEIWTVCAGDLPPGPYTAFIEELHSRWETSENTVLMRRAEDRLACARLGAAWRHLPIPDSVYRRLAPVQDPVGKTPVDLPGYAPSGSLVTHPSSQFSGQPFRESARYGLSAEALGSAAAGPGSAAAGPGSTELSPETIVEAQRAAYISGFLYPDYHAIFGPVRTEENTLVDSLAEELSQELPRRARLVCPLSVGGHIDHRFTRSVVERIGRPLWYYADYPYAEKKPEQVDLLAPAGMLMETTCLSEPDMQAWCDSILAYKSQISTFWSTEAAMCAALNAYHDRFHGLRLWHA